MVGLAAYVLLAAVWFTPAPVAVAEEGKAPAAAAAKPAAKFDLIGAKKCGMCHKAEPKGNQMGKWEASAHAKAFEVLKSDQAKAVAATKKLAKAPHEAPECLKCHVTAFPVMASLATAKITLEEGVSCESCHGPGSEYSKMATMKAITAGTQDAKAVGLQKIEAAVCQKCHNEESPTFKGFKYEEMVAKIAHPYPKGTKGGK
jgi:hypothetical protein